jgi:hypothetical protein
VSLLFNFEGSLKNLLYIKEVRDKRSEVRILIQDFNLHPTSDILLLLKNCTLKNAYRK